jgi:threonine dehydratase
MATAAKLTRPAIRVIGVEPAGADALSRSLAAGRLVQLDKVDTVADGLAPPFTGRHVLERAQRYVDDVLTVSDTEILRALRAVIERLEVVAEPSAAAGFAALLCRHVKAKPGQTVGLILSGGNVTSDRLRELLR